MASALSTLSRPLSGAVSWLGARALGARLGDHAVLELRIDGQSGAPLPLLALLEFAARQAGVRGVLIELASVPWGWASLREWRLGLERIRAMGRSVVIFAHSPGNAGLYIGSVADRLLVPAMGEVSLLGVGGRLRFFGPALDRLGLQFDVVSAGAYKSFGESFTRRVASPQNREATTALISALNEELMSALESSRGLSQEQLAACLEAGPMSAEQAVEVGLIDAIAYDADLDSVLQELCREEVTRVPLGGLVKPLSVLRRIQQHSSALPQVAVVHLSGNITMGTEPGGRQRIAPTEVIPVLQALAEDEQVKAVVLAVNSPGGSVLASDLIWKQVAELDKSKPVVACFGDVAASGGYYISTPARALFASPGTITGSIGVVGGKLVTGGGEAKLGIFSEAVGGGPYVGMYQPDAPFDPRQRARFKERLAQAYDVFLQRVSQGRGRSVAELEPMAQGRVWAGAQALEGGLVDGLGGITEALSKARELAGMVGLWARRDQSVRPPRSVLTELLPKLISQVLGLTPLASVGAAALARFPAAAQMLLQSPGQALVVMPEELELS